MTSSAGAWLPPDWPYPTRVELSTGHHLRPLLSSDVDLHMQAVLGSQERLWSVYGEAWGWPPEGLSAQQDQSDLARREAATRRRQSFSYALFDLGETELLGCVHIDPPQGPDAGAEISWWVVDWLVGGVIEHALDRFVPAWIATEWPIARPVTGPWAARLADLPPWKQLTAQETACGVVWLYRGLCVLRSQPQSPRRSSLPG